MQKRGEHGVVVLVGLFFVIFLTITCHYFVIAVENEHISASLDVNTAEIIVGQSQGTIYDRNMKPLVNSEMKYYAAVVPSAVDEKEMIKYAVDKADFLRKFSEGKPFSFECTIDTPESDGATVFELPQRYSDSQIAQHIVGYAADDKGVAGIEYAYDRILRGDYRDNKVIYSADGYGRVLIGDGKTIEKSSASKTGVVTTIDKNMQLICEESGSSIKKGAIVLTEIITGDILAMASFPTYSANDIEGALADEECPMINRALYSYGVGSIFKLVTSIESINEDREDFTYNCKGSINIGGQIFNCHKADGHGKLDMKQAVRDSCNTYFIALSRELEVEKFRSLGYSLGLGRENVLCAGVIGSAGVLPTVRDLSIPAELANFSFGQGKLAATPLQINQLTCAIANNGKMPVLRLIKGITLDGENTANEKEPYYSSVIDERTAEKIRDMMIFAIMDNRDSNAAPRYTTVGAKTSTAQTGRFDSEENELCHAWITGFFPADRPKYALTVLVEDGGYGNDAAAPVFRKIADRIIKSEKS